MIASCSCKGKNKTTTERSRKACARCLLRHCLYLFDQYVNHCRKWKRPSLSHSVLQSFCAWPGGITFEDLERLIHWVFAVPQVPKFQFSVVGECMSDFASTQEAQTFLFQWLLCQRLGQDLKWPCRWQLEMWHVVVGMRRYVSAIQSRAFEILPFVLLLTVGGFKRQAALYFCTRLVPLQISTTSAWNGQRNEISWKLIKDLIYREERWYYELWVLIYRVPLSTTSCHFFFFNIPYSCLTTFFCTHGGVFVNMCNRRVKIESPTLCKFPVSSVF